jgi:hypothetical protein
MYKLIRKIPVPVAHINKTWNSVLSPNFLNDLNLVGFYRNPNLVQEILIFFLKIIISINNPKWFFFSFNFIFKKNKPCYQFTTLGELAHNTGSTMV